MRGGQPVTGLNLACEAVIEAPFSVGNVLVPPNFLSNLPNAAEYEAERERGQHSYQFEDCRHDWVLVIRAGRQLATARVTEPLLGLESNRRYNRVWNTC
jgi:hypothetical protein